MKTFVVIKQTTEAIEVEALDGADAWNRVEYFGQGKAHKVPVESCIGVFLIKEAEETS